MRNRHPLIDSICLLATLALMAGCSRGSLAPSQTVLLDMTYPFGESSIYWPTGNPFRLASVAHGINEHGWFYASNDYAANEHGGTHVDAPIHFAENGRTIDEVPLHEWIGPAVVIDVTERCRADRDYLLTADDVRAWEELHGPIPAGAWVLMFTGIGTQHYPDPTQVLGTDRTGPEAVAELSFPGFSAESVAYLLEKREITGIGLDTPSIDYGPSADFPVHRLLLGANKLAIENIARLDRLPATGATLYAIPMLIEGGTGAPARVFATVPASKSPGQRRLG